MRRLLLLACLLLLVPAQAWALQDTCTFSASGNWSAIGTHPTASCTGGDNNATIDADDIVVIPDGITINRTGALTFSSTAGVKLTVQDGGTFVEDVGDHASNQGTTFTRGVEGIEVASGGTWTIQDQWLDASSGTLAYTDVGSGVPPHLLTVSEVIPCPVDEDGESAGGVEAASATTEGPYEPNCTTGNANELMLRFDNSAAGEDGDSFANEVLAGVTAGRTIWCWSESDPDKPVVDSNACYEVVVVNTSECGTPGADSCFVTIDVRQGDQDSSYRLARRDIAQGCLAAQLDAGTLEIEVDDCSGGSFFGTTQTFTGSGLDDMTNNGQTSVNATTDYQVVIDATAPSPDTFEWFKDGVSQASGVGITGSAQTLDEGLTVTFSDIDNHTLNDQWDIEATPWYYSARWIGFHESAEGDTACADGDGTACQMGELTQMPLEHAFDAAHQFASNSTDTLFIGDPLGARKTYADNTIIWITYGQAGGETGAFREPIRHISATAESVDQGDSEATINDSAVVTLNGGIFDGLAMLFDVPDDFIANWTWIVDAAAVGTACQTGQVWRMDGSDNARFSHTSQSGGSAEVGASCDRLHVFGSQEGTTNPQIHYGRYRHYGDDGVTMPDSPANPNSGYDAKGLAWEFRSDAAQSAEVFQTNGLTSGTISGIYCGLCTSSIASDGMIIRGEAAISTTVTVSDVLGMGYFGELSNADEGWNVSNLSSYGSVSHIAGSGCLPGDAQNFVCDRFRGMAASTTPIATVGSSEQRNGIYRRNEVRGREGITIDDNGVFSNILIERNTIGGAGEASTPCTPGSSTSSCAIVALTAGGGGTDNMTIEDITVIGTPGAGILLDVQDLQTGGTLSRILLVDQKESCAGCRALGSSEADVQQLAAGETDGWCFNNNVGAAATSSDVLAPAEDDLPPGSLRGVNPLFLDPARNQFLPSPAGQVSVALCGAKKNAGVTRKGYGHYLRRLEPDFLSTGALGGGGGGNCPRPGCPKP